MKANELRLGNLVKYEGKVYAIDSISTEFPTLNTMEFGIGVVDWNNIEPVPLAEELLVKVGFEKQKNNWKKLTICNDWTNIFWESLAGIEISVNKHSIMLPHINYVHQLQNLYFALTSQELTFEP